MNFYERVRRVICELLEEEASWEKLKNTSLPIVVYGTGNGADRVFDELERLGIPVAAVSASDGFVRRRRFRGFDVKSVAQLEQELGAFMIALAFASPLPDVIESIRALEKRHPLLMPSVPVYGNNIFNKEFLRENIDSIENAVGLLADDWSRKVFEGIIKFQITGNLHHCFDCESDKAEAFSLLSLTNNENYLDLGAYRGDTVDEFLNYTGGYTSVTAVEPDKRAFKKLHKHCEALENIRLVNAAVWCDGGGILLDGGKGRGSSVGADGERAATVTVDGICPSCGFSYIKADVEGSEYELLEGAQSVLRRFKPKLNIAAYHRSEDIFKLINRIHGINGDYKIYLRHHPHISLWDTNIYCV